MERNQFRAKSQFVPPFCILSLSSEQMLWDIFDSMYVNFIRQGQFHCLWKIAKKSNVHQLEKYCYNTCMYKLGKITE